MFSAAKQGDRWQTQLNLARDSLGRGGVRSVCICLFVCLFVLPACLRADLSAALCGGAGRRYLHAARSALCRCTTLVLLVSTC